jgi:hypothetical protein
MANANLGRRGRESCLENRVVFLEVRETVDADNRGRKEESIERVVTWAAAILTVENGIRGSWSPN